jgi:hypothetical protein
MLSVYLWQTYQGLLAFIFGVRSENGKEERGIPQEKIDGEELDV